MPPTRYEIIGTEGGRVRPILLLAYRKPWGVYVALRIARRRMVRLGVGPLFNRFYAARVSWTKEHELRNW